MASSAMAWKVSRSDSWLSSSLKFSSWRTVWRKNFFGASCSALIPTTFCPGSTALIVSTRSSSLSLLGLGILSRSNLRSSSTLMTITAALNQGGFRHGETVLDCLCHR